MKFKVKSDLSIMEVFMKVLLLSIGFGIIGIVIASIIGVATNSDEMAVLFLAFYAVLLIALLISYILKATLNSIVFGSSTEETKIEKLLEEVLKELKAANESKGIYTKNDNLSSFEKERLEKETGNKI